MLTSNLNEKDNLGLGVMGKTAVITGASQGIGKAMARVFSRAGVHLFLIARNEEKLQNIKRELASYNVTIDYFAVDLTDEAAVKDAFKTMASSGGIDILINNAGAMTAKPLAFIKKGDLLDQFEVNTFSVIQCCQLASRLMIRNGGGSIINVSSMLGEYGQQGQSIYAASKSAVSGITRSLAQELACHQIRVNAIAPGIIDTQLINELSSEEKECTLNRIALQRLGEPDEVANVSLFLASQWSSYMTGQVIGIDGGIHF